jgi:hypothetical protein
MVSAGSSAFFFSLPINLRVPLNPNLPQDSHTQYILTCLCIGETNQFASNAWIVTAVREEQMLCESLQEYQVSVRQLPIIYLSRSE